MVLGSWFYSASVRALVCVVPVLMFCASAHAQSAADLILRIDRLESQVRALTGEVERLQFELKKSEDLNARLQQDVDYRFQELQGTRPGSVPPRSGGSAGQRRGEAGVPAPVNPSAVSSASVSSAPAASAVSPSAAYGVEPPLTQVGGGAGRGAPPQPLGQLNSSGVALEYPGGSNPSGAGPQVLTPQGLSSGQASSHDGSKVDNASTVPLAASPRDAYDLAYGFVLRGDYDLAEQHFKQFLDAHPQDRLTGNAHFWLGESYYQRALYTDAAQAFLDSYKKFPANTKAPDSLLKLGLSLKALGEKEQACATLAQVAAKYPHAQKAVRDAQAEQRRAGC